MNDRTIHLTGYFATEDSCAEAVEVLHHGGLGPAHVFHPFPSEKVQEAGGKAKSPVRLWVLLGGILGCCTGFALTIGLSTEYPHRTAGMPIISIPPFVIIAFELTILFGTLSGLLGLLFHGGFPRFDPLPSYDPAFSGAKFGVVVDCAEGERSRIEEILRDAGAVEVKHAA
jgi:Alternative complex III, ActD subunit